MGKPAKGKTTTNDMPVDERINQWRTLARRYAMTAEEACTPDEEEEQDVPIAAAAAALATMYLALALARDAAQFGDLPDAY